MWTTLLLMAMAVSLEPVRIGLTVLMLNRPRPLLQLLAFLCGGFVMGVTVGVAVLVVLDAAPTSAAHFTVPKVQVVIGAAALVAAAVLAAGVGVRRRVAVPLAAARPGEPGAGAPAGPPVGPATTWHRVSARTRGLAQGSSLWVAGVSGLSIALPSLDYFAALAVIHAGGGSAAAQLGALLVFNVVAFALVELPLLSYAVAPGRTVAAMSALQRWLRARTRRDVALILAAVGLLFIGLGAVGL